MADVRNLKGGVVHRLMIHKKLALISTLGMVIVGVAAEALSTPTAVPNRVDELKFSLVQL